MTFNQEFFDELRKINQSDLGAIFPDSIRPRVSEMKAAGVVSNRFVALLEELIMRLNIKLNDHGLNVDFIA